MAEHPVQSAVSDLRSILRWLGLALVVVAVLVAWMATFQLPSEDIFTTWYNFLLPMSYLVPGVILLLRRNWHVVGWLLCLFAVGSAFSSDWSLQALDNQWLVFLQDMYQGTWFWFPMLALLVVFPDGLARQTRRQRAVGRILIGVGGLAVILELFKAEVGVTEPQISNPLGIGFLPSEVEEVAIAGLFIAMLVALGSLIWRYRSADQVARRQFRWVLLAIVLLVLALIVGVVGSETAGVDDGPWWIPILFAYLFLPVSIMVAILRYRLYEIDRIVSRTISYAMVVAVLAAVFFGVTALLSSLIPAESDLAVAASTLAVAALFNPLRRRIQIWVQRRFNRSRYNADLVVDRFTASLRDRIDPESVVQEWIEVVARTMQPASMGVWVRHQPRM